MKSSMYIHYPLRSLRRGGLHTVLAIFCIATGIMAIVSLQLVGQMVTTALTSNVREANGGDIAVYASSPAFSHSDLPFFDKLKSDGTISGYTPLVNLFGSLPLAGRGRSGFTIKAVDPNHYPLVGALTFLTPKDGRVSTLLIGNQGIVTTSFLTQYGKKLGDMIAIQTTSVGQMRDRLHIKIAGVIDERGAFAQAGAAMLLSLTTYEQALQQVFPGNALSYNVIYVTATNQIQTNLAVNAIQNQFFQATTVTTADELKAQRASANNISKFLELAGLLALLVGGIGIVNTMQVLLTRRTLEIAMLKTTGYRTSHLYVLFGLEAGLLGLIGGLLGASAAVGTSYLVRDLVQQSFKLNLLFALDPWTLCGGVAVGVCTALIFGILPIARAAKTHPLNILREVPEGDRDEREKVTTRLVLLLAVLFSILAIVNLNYDIELGIQVVLITFVSLTLLGVCFAGLSQLLSRVPVLEHPDRKYLVIITLGAVLAVLLLFALPALGVPLMGAACLGGVLLLLPPSWKVSTKLALRNIGRQRTRTAATMLALFIGVFAVGLILTVGLDVQNQLNVAMNKDLHYNAYAIASAQEAAVFSARKAEMPGLKGYRQLIYAPTVPVTINGKPLQSLFRPDPSISAENLRLQRTTVVGYLSSMEGYDVAHHQFPEVQITSGRNLNASDTGTDSALIPSLLAQTYPLDLKVGDTITLNSAYGKGRRTITIVGIYTETTLDLLSIKNIVQVKVPVGTAKALSPAGREISLFYLQIDPQKISEAERAFGNLAPGGYIVSVADIGNIVDQYLGNIQLTLTAIASLSLLAGIIIIANAVALAMLEQRREIGILKSVGYTSTSILQQVLIENGIIGATSAVLATLLVTLILKLFAHLVFNDASFGMSLLSVLLLIGGAALLTMLTALLVAWGAIRVRPLEVLRYE